MSKEDWISCKDRYPDTKVVSSGLYCENLRSEQVLVQTKSHGMCVAELFVSKYYKDGKSEYKWFSYGTGGRRMTVMSKVLAWMKLPDKYEE